MGRYALCYLAALLLVGVALNDAKAQGPSLLDRIADGQSRPVSGHIQELGTSLKSTQDVQGKNRAYRKYSLENGDMLLDQVRRTREGSTVVTRTHIERRPDGKRQAHLLFSTVLGRGTAMTSYARGAMFHKGEGFGGFHAGVNLDGVTGPGNAKKSVRNLNGKMRQTDSRIKMYDSRKSLPWRPFGRLAKSIAGWNARHQVPRVFRKELQRAPKPR